MEIVLIVWLTGLALFSALGMYRQYKGSLDIEAFREAYYEEHDWRPSAFLLYFLLALILVFWPVTLLIAIISNWRRKDK